MIRDCAAYRAGKRVPGKLEINSAAAASEEDDTFVWIGLHEPTAEEIAGVRAQFDLDERVLADAIRTQIRPSMAVDGDVLYAVFKTVRYVPLEERIAVGQIVLIAGPSFVVSIQYGTESDLVGILRELEAMPELLRNGPCTVVYAAVDRIVDDFMPVLAGLDYALRDIEQAVFSPEVAEHAERIYRLKREVLDFQRASAPLTNLMIHLAAGRFPGVPQSVRDYYGGVEERMDRIAEEAERVSSLLSSMLDANGTQVALRQARVALEQTRIATQQNADMRKISSWIAIGAVPTVIAGLYGMNFDNLPGLHWPYGYGVVLTVVAGVCLLLYWLLHRSGWL